MSVAVPQVAEPKANATFCAAAPRATLTARTACYAAEAASKKPKGQEKRRTAAAWYAACRPAGGWEAGAARARRQAVAAVPKLVRRRR